MFVDRQKFVFASVRKLDGKGNPPNPLTRTDPLRTINHFTVAVFSDYMMLPCFLDLSDGFQHESSAVPREFCCLWILFRPLGMMNKEMPRHVICHNIQHIKKKI